MLFIKSEITNPAQNLATEEYLLKNFEEEIFFLWRNAPSVIIGKNQNAYSEIDIEYVKENNITVVRRNTGGGAVFHDLGNVNFSYITRFTEGEDISYERFTRPVCEFLKTLGANASFKGRNDILIDDKKISGNAQTVYKNRHLHHGTLLFSSDMTDLTKALTVNPLKIQSKGIKSVKARVSNISAHINKKIDVVEFMDSLFEYATKNYGEGEIYSLSKKDLVKIKELTNNKYATWGWNFGENPSYSFKKGAKFSGGIVEIGMNISEEIIKDLSIKGDFFGSGDIKELEEALNGKEHKEEVLKEALKDIEISKYLGTVTKEELLSLMF